MYLHPTLLFLSCWKSLAKYLFSMKCNICRVKYEGKQQDTCLYFMYPVFENFLNFKGQHNFQKSISIAYIIVSVRILHAVNQLGVLERPFSRKLFFCFLLLTDTDGQSIRLVLSSKQITLSDVVKKKNGRKQSFFFVAFIHQDEGCTLVIDVDKRDIEVRKKKSQKLKPSSYC